MIVVINVKLKFSKVIDYKHTYKSCMLSITNIAMKKYVDIIFYIYLGEVCISGHYMQE
jgi:hypothetical protein